MPKKKSKKNKGSSKEETKRELIFAEDMQSYAKVLKLLGDRRLTVIYPDGTELMAIIPGRLKKKYWCRIVPDDVILVSIRDFQVDKVDVIHKYTNEEVKSLIQYGEIPSKFESSGIAEEDNALEEGGFEWKVDGDDDEIDIDDI